MSKFFLALLLMVMAVPQGMGRTVDEKKVLEASKAIVKVNVPQTGSGSGWFITPDTIVTNCHVVDPIPEKQKDFVNIQVYDGASVLVVELVEVLGCNKYHDMALLKIKGDYRSKHVVELWNKHIHMLPEQMDSVWAVGFPAGVPRLITRGYYQYEAQISEEAFTCIISSAPIYPGNSGGALFWIDPLTNKVVIIGIPSAGHPDYPHLTCSVRVVDVIKYIGLGLPDTPFVDGVTKLPSTANQGEGHG